MIFFYIIDMFFKIYFDFQCLIPY